ncbi:MAG: DNA methyltransferase [Alistipes indistinctus]
MTTLKVGNSFSANGPILGLPTATVINILENNPPSGITGVRMTLNVVYNEDCETGLTRIPDESVDCVLTDQPYLYLKNQKLDVPFDEDLVFSEFKRMLKPKGFVVMFGRGTSFYRWNTKLANMGFQFKEEIVWDKSYCTSPLMAISRVHETISIFTKGKGIINRCKVPYLEMKGHNIDAIMADIKRMSVILHNPKSLKAVLQFLETNSRDTSDGWRSNNLSISSDITKEDRSASVMRSIQAGMNERSVIKNRLCRYNKAWRRGCTP